MILALFVLLIFTACAEADPSGAQTSTSSQPEVPAEDLFEGPPSADHQLLEFLSSNPTQAQLKERIESRPALLWDVYQTTLDKDLKQSLHQAFHGDLIEGADIVLTGSFARTNAIQGGVINYHHVYVHFNDFKLLYTSGSLAESTIQGDSARVGAGAHANREDCAGPAKACAAIQGDRVWLLKEKKHLSNVLIYEVESLPAELATSVLKLRKR